MRSKSSIALARRPAVKPPLRTDYGEKIVSALRTLLGWTHFRQIIALDDPLKRDFYAHTPPAFTV